MFTPILATKLYVPPLRPKVVLRPRLIERLNEGLSARCKLTLISAPAGCGKTTLVSEWLRQKDDDRRMKDGKGKLHPSDFVSHRSRFGWLSLDTADNDPIRFLTYLVAALQTIDTNM